jgi:hypothetical protein
VYEADQWLLAMLLITVALARIIWFVLFAALSFSHAKPTGAHRLIARVRQLRFDARKPKAVRETEDQNVARFGLFFNHQVAAYTLGGLALTAWSILVATQQTQTKAQRFSLAMLGITVVVSIGVSVLCRSPGTEMTRMGYESGLAVSSLALLFAMGFLLLGTFPGSWLRWVVAGFAILLSFRDVVETIIQMKVTATLFSRSPTPAPMTIKTTS